MENILKEFFEVSKNLSNKWVKYFDIYEENFKKFRNKDITFVEIGILNGGSLEVWQKYFGPKSRIIGIDINPECKKFEKDNIEIFIGNQSDPKFWESFFFKTGKVDIILDDGGHTNLDQIITTTECIKNINDGGLLMIEDTHTSYSKKYNSSNYYSFINFSKKIIDDVNNNVENPISKKFKYSLNRYIYSTIFYEGIVVFNINRKKCKPNQLINNNGITHDILDLTWYGNNTILGKYKDMTNVRIIKNILRIVKKILINKILKNFFQ